MFKEHFPHLDLKSDNLTLLSYKSNSPLEPYQINEGEDDFNFSNISLLLDNKVDYGKSDSQIDNFTVDLKFPSKISDIFESSAKNDLIDKLSTKTNILNEALERNKIISEKDMENFVNKKYRKDAYYKHFKVIFGKYLKNRINALKNKCFPELKKNKFSSPNYKYTGNPKEKENYNFLSYKVKDILTYGENKISKNRQYNNNLLIEYIEKNKNKAKDKISYEELICVLFQPLEKAIEDFYNDKKEFEKINHDKECLFYDIYFKKSTSFSLLEKNGFLKAVKRKKK
jgi:hypothetical protein